MQSVQCQRNQCTLKGQWLDSNNQVRPLSQYRNLVVPEQILAVSPA